ncbi:MAG: tRNA (guanosine(46)-N7)-methyltransferase TrmB [Pseudomonadota bacterium]
MNAPPPESKRRRVRSFVRRPGRMTDAQQRALQELLPRYALTDEGSDLRTQFERSAPLVIEIGCGNGDALVWMSGHEPNKNFIGIEVHEPGVGRLLRGLESNQRSNVRVAMRDAVVVLTDRAVAESIDELRVYFPDPWPKKRHHKRRLIQPAVIQLMARVLKTGGRLHLATDWQPYAEWMEEHLAARVDLEDISLPNRARPGWRPETHFERRGTRKGHTIVDLIYQKRES